MIHDNRRGNTTASFRCLDKQPAPRFQEIAPVVASVNRHSGGDAFKDAAFKKRQTALLNPLRDGRPLQRSCIHAGKAQRPEQIASASEKQRCTFVSRIQSGFFFPRVATGGPPVLPAVPFRSASVSPASADADLSLFWGSPGLKKGRRRAPLLAFRPRHHLPRLTFSGFALLVLCIFDDPLFLWQLLSARICQPLFTRRAKIVIDYSVAFPSTS